MKLNLITFLTVFSLKAVIAAPTVAPIGVMDKRDEAKFKRKELDTNAPLGEIWGKLDERDVSKIKRKELDTNAPLGVVWAKLDERDETLEM
ncbi:hypothetical protein K435DRAFT_864618 [Dendrothele bispora CBS 962.96]|uniref:Uncharacterized protein n=1 Tax=Dendrothele bispora (strain CBS 962.96) TaxID=1314807 RepID=A0A4S8L8E5_DENBC|nr:hypothetical protein K435DRAFT_869745 [Dendrothele bispora CBS 962.96]THU90060.1 hypothetical protein K435DRAFT_864618 [Dendrothele bispora CBS 962.96]